MKSPERLHNAVQNKLDTLNILDILKEHPYL